MVFVKVRETYDLQTTKNKMTVIAIHTPKTDIIKRNYPGLLMQCKAYRPVSCDVRIACASMLPLDPQGVGLAEGSVAPEDIFNPILYKALSNKGMSQLEARINAITNTGSGLDVDGSSAAAEIDSFSSASDEFNLYYGLLSDVHGWKHANPQQGLEMKSLRPLVYEMVYNVGDMSDSVYDVSGIPSFSYPANNGSALNMGIKAILGQAKPMPFIPCTSYSMEITKDAEKEEERSVTGTSAVGFPNAAGALTSASVDVPYLPVNVGCIIVPPSKLHELFYRMVVEWTIEFSSIRSIIEIADFPGGIGAVGSAQHYQNYSYSKVKEALTGSSETILDNDSCMVSSNVGVNKVM